MKLDPEKFFPVKLAAMLYENTQLQLELAQSQENMAKLMAENSALKKQALQPIFKQAKAKVDALAGELKQDGVEIEAIDWETGEIRNSAD